MGANSAGILVYRLSRGFLEVLLAHPGGPFWKNKDVGAWSIPKGEFAPGDDILAAAKREFYEETGYEADGEFMSLTPVKRRSGSLVYTFAIEDDFPAGPVQSNLFEMEWPPKSGRKSSFPEVDRIEWFDIPAAKEKITSYQVPILTELSQKLGEV